MSICTCEKIAETTFYVFKNHWITCTCETIRSQGEKCIENYLKKKNLQFKQEVSFPDCKNIHPLKFDFFINDIFLIEFDGLQHFKENKYYGGAIYFEKRLFNDTIKNKYCINKKIKLIRISYKEIKKIPEILENYITNLNNMELITYTNEQLYNVMKQKLNQ
jgi:hypothetical protein